jgi:hypothetical protein
MLVAAADPVQLVGLAELVAAALAVVQQLE